MSPSARRLSLIAPIIIALVSAAAVMAPRIPNPGFAGPTGVTIRGKTITEERGNMLYDRMKANGQAGILSAMPNALGSLADQLGGQIDAAAPGLLEGLGLADRIPDGSDISDVGGGIVDDVEQSGGLKTTTEDFVIRMADGRMRMDQGSMSMLFLTDAEEGVSQVWFIDHEAKQMWGMPSQAATLAGRVTGSAHSGMNISDPGPTQTLMGHSASRYTFDYETTSDPMAASLGAMQQQDENVKMAAVVETNGEAWIAAGVDGADEVASFYRSLAAAIGTFESGSEMQSGFASGLARLTDLGMPLKVIQESTVILEAQIETEAKSDTLAWTRATTTIESITREELDVDIFDSDGDPLSSYERSSMPGLAGAGGGAELHNRNASGDGNAINVRGKEGCDCSCTAFERMQEMSKDKKAMQNNPDAMKLAMCARECAMKWVACAQKSP